jgi:hypothetical protein
MTARTLQPLPLPGVGARPLPLSWRRFWHGLTRRAAGLGADIFSVRLAAEQELHLHDAAGWTVVCRSGAVWITQETDARDIFLKGGEGFALDRAGLAIVRACHGAMVAIRAPVGREAAGRLQGDARRRGADHTAAEDQADHTWLRSLYPESGPWNDPASYRRAGLL